MNNARNISVSEAENIPMDEIIELGYGCLFERLGTIGTERFISFISSNKFDYTEWRKGLFEGKSAKEIISAAAEYEESHPFTPRKPQKEINP